MTFYDKFTAVFVGSYLFRHYVCRVLHNSMRMENIFSNRYQRDILSKLTPRELQFRN